MSEVRHEDEFDCIRCGARVYHAAHSCPKCGLELYPDGPDEDELPESPQAGGGWFGRLRGPVPAVIAAVVLLAFTLPVVATAVPGFPVGPVALACVIAGAVAGVVVFLRKRRAETSDDGLYLELLQCTGFDQARAARLVEAERRAAPNATRPVLLRRAIARWRRDNG
jgi:hypothetical protein